MEKCYRQPEIFGAFGPCASLVAGRMERSALGVLQATSRAKRYEGWYRQIIYPGYWSRSTITRVTRPTVVHRRSAWNPRAVGWVASLSGWRYAKRDPDREDAASPAALYPFVR